MGHLFVDNKGYGGNVYKKVSMGAPGLVALVEAPRWGFQLGLIFFFAH